MGSLNAAGMTTQERTPAAPCACVDASGADASALLVARPCSAPCGDGAAAAAEHPGPAATPTRSLVLAFLVESCLSKVSGSYVLLELYVNHPTKCSAAVHPATDLESCKGSVVAPQKQHALGMLTQRQQQDFLLPC